jgi:hypothetical protein
MTTPDYIKNNKLVAYNTIFVPEDVKEAIKEDPSFKRVKKAKVLKNRKAVKKYREKLNKDNPKKKKKKLPLLPKPKRKKMLRDEYYEYKHLAEMALREMTTYYLTKRLDPSKDWTADEVHGPKIRRWLKVRDRYEMLHTLKKNGDLKLAKDNRLKRQAMKQFGGNAKIAVKWVYPSIRGKAMTAKQQKSYRDRICYYIKGGLPEDIAKRKAYKKLLLEEKFKDE